MIKRIKMSKTFSKHTMKNYAFNIQNELHEIETFSNTVMNEWMNFRYGKNYNRLKI